jgi:toxin ParE1/3/4
MRILWTEPALSDLEAIGDFISSENSVETAMRVLTVITNSVGSLADFPHLGRAGRAPNTRELIVPNTSYIVPYRVRDSQLQVLAVFHVSRRWPEVFN